MKAKLLVERLEILMSGFKQVRSELAEFESLEQNATATRMQLL